MRCDFLLVLILLQPNRSYLLTSIALALSELDFNNHQLTEIIQQHSELKVVGAVCAAEFWQSEANRR